MKRPTNANASVALFPFLAVLLCTMGSLVLLLMLIASQAKAKAEAERAEAAKPKVDLEAIKRREEDLQWKIDQLTKSREQTIADVADTRSQLSHLEEHSLRLRQELADLEAAEALLKSQKATDENGRAAVAADLAELRRKIEEAEKKLAAEKVAGRKPQAFAVVPYEGDRGTRRRPIYIECRGDAIILQPEGIKFTEADFAGSLGPSNPLATCVRVVSEYLTRGESYKEGEQPYPLLLVRPSGIGSYYVARAGMSSWEGEFGYELIDESWPLEFPPPDPLLTQLANKAVEEARVRQVMLARAAPSLRGKGPKATFRVAPSGGGLVQVDGGDGGSYGGSRESRYSATRGPRGGGGYSSERPKEDRFASVNGGNAAGPTGTGPGFGGPGFGGPGFGGAAPGGSAGTGSSPSVSGGAPLVGVEPTIGGAAGDNRYGGAGSGSGYGTTGGAIGPTGSGVAPTGGLADGGPAASGTTGAGGAGTSGYVGERYASSGQAGTPSGVPGAQSGVAGSADNTTGPSLGAPATGTPGGMSNGYSTMRSADGTASGNSSDGFASGTGGVPQNGFAQSGGMGASGDGSSAPSGVAGTGGGQPGDGSSSAGASGASASGAAGSSFGSSGSSSGGGGGGGSPMGDPGAPQNITMSQQVPPPGVGEYVESMANKRGKNWGLPEEHRRSTPLTRPVQVYCSGNQLTLFNDKGIPDKQIVMEGPTENSVDTLVSTVWDQVTTWGIAGRGMYWKPKLVVHVAPDGAIRFNELKQLLDGSGLEVTGKQIAVAAPVAGGRR